MLSSSMITPPRSTEDLVLLDVSTRARMNILILQVTGHPLDKATDLYVAKLYPLEITAAELPQSGQ